MHLEITNLELQLHLSHQQNKWFNIPTAVIAFPDMLVGVEQSILFMSAISIRWGCLVVQVSVQYIPRNMHTVFPLLCFVVVIHWLIFPYPSGLLHWHCGNLTIAPVPAKQPWWIWINTSCEFIMNDCITTTKQSTTKSCAYFLGYTVHIMSTTHSMSALQCHGLP